MFKICQITLLFAKALSLSFRRKKKNSPLIYHPPQIFCCPPTGDAQHCWSPRAPSTWALQGTTEHPSVYMDSLLSPQQQLHALCLSLCQCLFSVIKRHPEYSLNPLLQNLSFRSRVGILRPMDQIQPCGLVFPNKMSLECSHTHLFIFCLTSLYALQLSSRDRECMTCKA